MNKDFHSLMLIVEPVYSSLFCQKSDKGRGQGCYNLVDRRRGKKSTEEETGKSFVRSSYSNSFICNHRHSKFEELVKHRNCYF